LQKGSHPFDKKEIYNASGEHFRVDLQPFQGIIFQAQLPDGAEVAEQEQVCPDNGNSIPEFPSDQELP
jgi:hypothetical protein